MFVNEMQYETNWRRLGLAYSVGSLIAGGIFMCGFVIIATISDLKKTNAWPIWDLQELQAAFLLWILVSISWLIGQVFLASPLWLWLHGHGHRHWKYSVFIGALFVPTTTAFLGLNMSWGYLAFALWGGVMGWIIWRIAYYQPSASAP